MAASALIFSAAECGDSVPHPSQASPFPALHPSSIQPLTPQHPILHEPDFSLQLRLMDIIFCYMSLSSFTLLLLSLDLNFSCLLKTRSCPSPSLPSPCHYLFPVTTPNHLSSTNLSFPLHYLSSAAHIFLPPLSFPLCYLTATASASFLLPPASLRGPVSLRTSRVPSWPPLLPGCRNALTTRQLFPRDGPVAGSWWDGSG